MTIYATGGDTITIARNGRRWHVATAGGAWLPPTDLPDTPPAKALADGHEVHFDAREHRLEWENDVCHTSAPAEGTDEHDAAETMRRLLDFMRRDPRACVCVLHKLATSGTCRGTASALGINFKAVRKNVERAAKEYIGLRRILHIRKARK